MKLIAGVLKKDLEQHFSVLISFPIRNPACALIVYLSTNPHTALMRFGYNNE